MISFDGNERQISWVKRECENLDKYCVSEFPLSDRQWEFVADWIARDVRIAKSKGDEVRELLFNVIEPWDRKANSRC